MKGNRLTVMKKQKSIRDSQSYVMLDASRGKNDANEND